MKKLRNLNSRPQSAYGIVVCCALSVLISACGFHLRGATKLPEGMRKIYAEGFLPGSSFLPSLAQDLKHSGGRLTYKREEAELVIRALNEEYIRREVSLSDSGKANMYELTYRLDFDLEEPAGESILEPKNITIVREYYNPQVNVIGKSEEESVIRKEMYREAVRSLLRSLEVATQGRSSTR